MVSTSIFDFSIYLSISSKIFQLYPFVFLSIVQDVLTVIFLCIRFKPLINVF